MQSLQGQKAGHTEPGEINDTGMKDGDGSSRRQRDGPDKTRRKGKRGRQRPALDRNRCLIIEKCVL